MKIDRIIHQRAKALGIRITPYRTKKNLIRDIQKQEGGKPCFWTDWRHRCKGRCEWSGECRECLVAVWMR